MKQPVDWVIGHHRAEYAIRMHGAHVAADAPRGLSQRYWPSAGPCLHEATDMQEWLNSLEIGGMTALPVRARRLTAC